MDAAIEIEGVYKKFVRQADRHRSYLLRDLLLEISGLRRDNRTLRTDEFWAVENVFLRVEPGESVALVGRNGAGKSTLLKLIAGLLKPDAGRITIRGRMQSLINLGAGFNARLSGRENILNAGAVQGFSTRQMKAIEAEVIDFAEIEEFIDNPVHTYSSGMRARLGYAIAVHLQPDILLLDEVLAVGDFLFQNKCHLKMQELRHSGVTTVTVSHSHARLLQSCKKAAWIERGRLRAYGTTHEVIQSYLETTTAEAGLKASASKMPEDDEPYGLVHHEPSRIVEVRVDANDRHGSEPRTYAEDAALELAFSFQLKRPVTRLALSWVLFEEGGKRLALVSNRDRAELPTSTAGLCEGEFTLPRLGLAPGRYVLVLCINDGESLLYRKPVRTFAVHGDPTPGRGPLRPEFYLNLQTPQPTHAPVQAQT
ncbi:MAG: polysaccharide ABC transporter ATP-binding protein [Opitutales bacterium]